MCFLNQEKVQTEETEVLQRLKEKNKRALVC